MKRVFITGSSGAVGRTLLRRLRQSEQRYEIFAPARHTSTNGLDVRDHERLSAAVCEFKPELIFHLAADFSPDFASSYAVNVASSKVLLESAERLDTSPRVVLIGSAAEYGYVLPEDCPVAETRVLRPISVYGLTKAWQTNLASLYASRNVDVIVARIFNLYGEGLSERMFAGKIQKQIEQIELGSRSSIEIGSLSAIRDYISIPDAIDQLLSISHFGNRGSVYHVGSGKPISMREFLAQQLAARNLVGVPIVEEPHRASQRIYDVPAIYADMSKTTALIKSCGGDVDA